MHKIWWGQNIFVILHRQTKNNNSKTFRTMKTFEELKAQVLATKSISWMTAEERDFYISEQLKRKDEQNRIEKQERKTRSSQRYQISRQQREVSVIED